MLMFYIINSSCFFSAVYIGRDHSARSDSTQLNWRRVLWSLSWELSSWVHLNRVGWCDHSKTQLNSTGHGRRSHRSWGTCPPLLEAKGTGRHNLGIIHISHNYCSYHAVALMSTPQTYELGWLSYLSNILSPTGQKVGAKKCSACFARRICLPLSKS